MSKARFEKARRIAAADKMPVTPFSGPRYHENQSKCGDSLPCVHCGKPIKSPTVWAEVIDGGSAYGPNDETADINHPGYMAMFPVGPECRKYLRRHGVVLIQTGAPK